MAHVFISYIRENEDAVRRLADALQAHGVNVWRDRDSIEPGTLWRHAIEKAIRHNDFFIACFSKEYEQRPKTHMNEELLLAIEELRTRPFDRAWFIPVLLSACKIPEYDIGAGAKLTHIQWVDLSSEWEAGIQKIIDVIDPIPAEAQVHMAALRSSDPLVRLSAAGQLAKIGNRRAVPALIEALSDPDMHVRADVASALSQIADPRAVPALIKALVDKEYDRVRMQAQGALISIGKEAIRGLEEAALQEENRAIQKAAKSLLEVMNPRRA